ncbi:MAG TPA: hypothetical protein VM366_05695 [Anaerolineae bacterium]|nr:hypothetical protein [Anaerolineae bacterium]
MLKRTIASAILITLLLATPVGVVLADDPAAPTPTVTAEAGLPDTTPTPEPALATPTAADPASPEDEPAVPETATTLEETEPTAADPMRASASLGAAAVQATAAVTPTPTAEPKPVTPTPTVPATTPSPATSYVAALVGETVVPLGGRGNSEVFVSFVDIESGIQEFELRLTFDPDIIRVEGKDGAQITTRSPVDVASVDNEKGVIVLVLRRSKDALLRSTNAWEKIATVTWTARREGKSVIAIAKNSTFVTAAGDRLTPDATYDGVVFARAPGTMHGRVVLQGRGNHAGASVSGALSKSRTDAAVTDESGRFAISTSHGEGFYTIVVAKQGYLTAESERPVKMTVDAVVNLGEITLVGGDVNGDNEIDVRDLAYVAWHFDERDPKADINGDGIVDIFDLSLIAGNFGRKGPIEWEVSD